MRRPILILANSIYHLCIALWIGSLVGIGTMATPAALCTLQGEMKPQAEGIVSSALQVANQWGLGLLAIALAVATFELFYRKRLNTKHLLLYRVLLTLAGLLSVTYVWGQLWPQMNQRRVLGDTDAYSALHALYANIARLQILLGATLIVLTNAVNIGPRRDGGHPRN